VGADTGIQIGNHWVLLAGIAATAAGVWHFTRTVMGGLDERIQTNLHLWAGNGGGERIRKLVQEGVERGLEGHRLQCPLRTDIQELEDRIRELEDAANETDRGRS
jgi:hypothetical protein